MVFVQAAVMWWGMTWLLYILARTWNAVFSALAATEQCPEVLTVGNWGNNDRFGLMRAGEFGIRTLIETARLPHTAMIRAIGRRLGCWCQCRGDDDDRDQEAIHAD